MPFTKENRRYTFNGITLVAVVSIAAFYISELKALSAFQLSPLMVGVLIGMLYGNTLRGTFPNKWSLGVKFCSKRLLRFAVALYGFRLTFQQIADVGLIGLFASLIVVVLTMLVGTAIGSYLLKMDRATSFLTAIGAAICGAAAVLAAETVIKAKPSQASVALLTVVLFGTIAMFAYPAMYQAGLLHMSPAEYGVYTGATVHEVAHVVAAGNAVGPVAGEISVIVKMTRVMMLAPVLLIIGLFLAKQQITPDGESHLRIPVPWFAFGFIACVGINSLGVIPPNATDLIVKFDIFLLTMAMTALGMETSLKEVKAMGLRPFVLAGVLFIWLLLGGYFLIKTLNFLI